MRCIEFFLPLKTEIILTLAEVQPTAAERRMVSMGRWCYIIGVHC